MCGFRVGYDLENFISIKFNMADLRPSLTLISVTVLDFEESPGARGLQIYCRALY